MKKYNYTVTTMHFGVNQGMIEVPNHLTEKQIKEEILKNIGYYLQDKSDTIMNFDIYEIEPKADKINTDEIYIKLSDIENIVRYEYIGPYDRPKPIVMFNQLVSDNNITKYVYDLATSEFDKLENYVYKGVKK